MGLENELHPECSASDVVPKDFGDLECGRYQSVGTGGVGKKALDSSSVVR